MNNNEITIREFAKNNKIPSHKVISLLKESPDNPLKYKKNIRPTEMVDEEVLKNVTYSPTLITIAEYAKSNNFNQEEIILFLKRFNNGNFEEIKATSEIDMIYLDFFKEFKINDRLRLAKELKKLKSANIKHTFNNKYLIYLDVKRVRNNRHININYILNKQFNKYLVKMNYPSKLKIKLIRTKSKGTGNWIMSEKEFEDIRKSSIDDIYK